MLLAAALAGIRTAQAQESRMALLIGNAQYKFSPLRNPVNDVRLMEAALKEAGFQVQRAENVSRRDMQRLIRAFGDRLKQSGGVGLFYFSGHGLQMKGANYLVPVDADIRAEEEVAYDSVDAQSVLDKMEAAGNRMNLLILDACRSNPFPNSSRAAAVGLAQMNAPSGSLVAYSTAPGSVALDGRGSNSPYTQHLAQAIVQPGVPVEEVFKQVRTAVRRETRNAQTPWENTALEGQFFFKPSLVQTSATAPAQPPGTTDPAAIDLAFWDSIKASSQAAELEAYLSQFPEGRFAALARARLASAKPAGGSVQASPGPMAASLLPPGPSSRNAEGRLTIKNELTGQQSVVDVRVATETESATTYSSGDVIANDGRALTARFGSYVGTAMSGALWRFPLRAGDGGTAQLQFEGGSTWGDFSWRVVSVANGIAKIEAQIGIPSNGLVRARRFGTWRAEFREQETLASRSQLQVRLDSGGAQSPDVVSTVWQPNAVPASALGNSAVLGRMLIRDALYGQTQEIGVEVTERTPRRTTYSTGDVIEANGQVTAVRLGDLVASVRSGRLWRLPLQAGESGSAALDIRGQKVPGSIEWRVVSRQGDTAVLEATLNYYAVTAAGTAHNLETSRRYGTWTGTFRDELPLAASYRMETRNMTYRGIPDTLIGEVQRVVAK
ncbi:caspase family protein [Variovorax terrae]|uniref:Caspase family protein n=1 Tax=Variovorax terrae TaxID=2923278 RepID=A0A9X1VYS7_9BURK|nr:caspase family protein [Variovorax terrae]MCJ0765850.1 caspase family protein [Variovorax terrae]